MRKKYVFVSIMRSHTVQFVLLEVKLVSVVYFMIVCCFNKIFSWESHLILEK